MQSHFWSINCGWGNCRSSGSLGICSQRPGNGHRQKQGTQDPQAHWVACPKVSVTGTWVSGSCSSSSGLHEPHLHSRGQCSAFWICPFLRKLVGKRNACCKLGTLQKWGGKVLSRNTKLHLSSVLLGQVSI